MFNVGLILGKFAPLTKGHLTAFSMALMKCHTLKVVVCIDHIHDPEDCPLSPEARIQAVKDECSKLSKRIKVEVIDCTSFPYAKEDSDEVSKYWAQELHLRFPEVKTLFGSELYVEMMAKHWPDCMGVNYEILDKGRSMTHISATEIRKDPVRHWGHIPSRVKPYFTKNVLVLGAESCGKSTLCRTLAHILKAPMVPEMYRSIYLNKGMDFTSTDLLDVADAQYEAQKEAMLSVFNKGIVMHDTCCEITQMYLREYYEKASDFDHVFRTIGEQVEAEPKFDLIFFCDVNTPWVNDGTRTLGNGADRKRMRDKAYSIAVQKAKRHGCKLVVLPADYQRLPAALEAIKEVYQ